MVTIKAGTRSSALAIRQTELVILAMQKKNPDVTFEVSFRKTKGDKLLSVPLTEFGGKGAFVEELEREILQGGIDIAVHSAKDMPMELSEGLEIWAVLKRADPRDVLLTKKDHEGKELKRIGTSSKRRELQVKELLGAECGLLRGNVPTRIEKLKNDMYDGIILAAAGIDRLGHNADKELNYRYFSVEEMVPAGGQGIIVIEGRRDDKRKELFAAINEEETFWELETERYILKELQAGCHEPVGVFSRIEEEQITIRLLLEQEGRICRGVVKGAVSERFELAKKLITEVKCHE